MIIEVELAAVIALLSSRLLLLLLHRGSTQVEEAAAVAPAPAPPPVLPAPAPVVEPAIEHMPPDAVVEVVVHRNGEWVHQGWVREGTHAYRHALHSLGLGVRKNGEVHHRHGGSQA